MKLAISNLAWPKESDPMVAELMREIGIPGVEIAPTKVWHRPLEVSDAEIQTYRQFWEARGIRAVAMQALLFGKPDLVLFEGENERAETLTYLAEMARIGGALGAGPLVFGSPKNRRVGDLSEEEAQTIAIPFFRAAGRAAHRYGTVLCIEPNPVAYSCDFITTSTQGLELVRTVGEGGFGLHLDAAGMWLSEEPIERALDRCAGIVRHFHVSEPQLGPIGNGGVDHARFAAALRRIGYSNWVSVEMRHNPDLDVETEIRRVLSYLVDTYGD